MSKRMDLPSYCVICKPPTPEPRPEEEDEFMTVIERPGVVHRSECPTLDWMKPTQEDIDAFEKMAKQQRLALRDIHNIFIST